MLYLYSLLEFVRCCYYFLCLYFLYYYFLYYYFLSYYFLSYYFLYYYFLYCCVSLLLLSLPSRLLNRKRRGSDIGLWVLQ